MEKMRKQRLKIITFCLLFLGLISLASAQEGRGRGRIFGSVTDENGNPVNGAEIVCQSLEFNLILKTTSNKKGNWAIAGLGSGIFRISASKSGYLPSETQMKISHFRNPPVDFVLKSIESSDVQAMEGGEVSKELFREATTLFNQEKYDAALQLFRSFLEENPTLFQVRINIGNCYREMGEYENALTEYQAVLDLLKEKNPDLQGNKDAAMALSNMGETYILMNDIEKAHFFLRQAIEIFPKDHALAYNIAEIYFDNGKIDQAIEYYELAIQIKPDWPLAYLKKGYAYLNKADFVEAISSFNKFLELAPEDEEAEKIRNLITQLEKIKKN